MLTRLRSWITAAPGRETLPTRADADVALTQLVGEAYEAMLPEFSRTDDARRIFDETNKLQIQLSRRAPEYDRYRPEFEAEVQRLRSELHALRRDIRQ